MVLMPTLTLTLTLTQTLAMMSRCVLSDVMVTRFNPRWARINKFYFLCKKIRSRIVVNLTLSLTLILTQTLTLTLTQGKEGKNLSVHSDPAFPKETHDFDGAQNWTAPELEIELRSRGLSDVGTKNDRIVRVLQVPALLSLNPAFELRVLQAELKRRGESHATMNIYQLQALLRNLDEGVDSRGLEGLCDAAHKLLEASLLTLSLSLTITLTLVLTLTMVMVMSQATLILTP